VDGHIVSKVLIEESIPLSSVKKTEESKSLRLPPISLWIALLVIVGIVGYYFLFPAVYNHFIAKKQTPTQTAAVQKNETQDKNDARGKPGAAATPTDKPQENTTSGIKKIVPPLKKVAVNVEAANVRVAPDINSQRIGIILKGEVLKVLAEQNDANNLTWYKIILYEGREGWIASTVVSTAGDR
jgi:hypothetical protein